MNEMNKEETTRYVSTVHAKFMLCYLLLFRGNNMEILSSWVSNKIYQLLFGFKPFMKGSAQNQLQSLKSFSFCHVYANHRHLL